MVSKRTSGNVAVGFCLDETGSMGGIRDKTISGFNEYIGELRKQSGATRLSLTMFSDMSASEATHREFCVDTDIADVKDLDYVSYNPRGSTPLFDAIGYTIKNMERRLTSSPDDWSVLVVIQTDGQENASREYTRQQVFDLIREKELAGWRFVYLGADQDDYTAENAARLMGMSVGSSVAYVSSTQGQTVSSVSATTNAFRANPTMSSAELADVTKKEREKRLKKEKT